jgi:hypothetical protein
MMTLAQRCPFCNVTITFEVENPQDGRAVAAMRNLERDRHFTYSCPKVSRAVRNAAGRRIHWTN